MKELSIEEKAKRYDEAKLRMSAAYNSNRCTIGFMNEIFPELKESEDERIRKELLEHCKNQAKPYIQTGNKCPQIQSWIAWLEKQGEQKPADKVEPKFKVKYAGSEYNVLEVKDIAGVTYYGIEDEPNHIDYVQAENCERISGYSIKENGSSYPTKPAKFSEQNSAWSEEDERKLQLLIVMCDETKGDSVTYSTMYREMEELKTWLKSLKDRYTWRPSDEQIYALRSVVTELKHSDNKYQETIEDLYQDLKKLIEE